MRPNTDHHATAKRRLTLPTVTLLAAFACAPGLLGAQKMTYYTYSTNSTDLESCRNFNSIHRAVWSSADPKGDNLNVSYPVVAAVDAASPAGVAGIANGDSLVAVNGTSTLRSSAPEISLWHLDVGARNVASIKRGSRMLEVAFEMGEWVAAPGAATEPDPATGQPRLRRLCRSAKP